MRQMATITATNESAFTAKQARGARRGPAAAPAITGPTARERLNCSEFRATALGMWSGGTTLVSTAW